MKCVLCEKEIDWEHHLPPLAYLKYDNSLIERFCPTCWDRIWAEWYKYGSDGIMDLTFEYPSNEYIIEKYKGNALVAKIPGVSFAELHKKPDPLSSRLKKIGLDKKKHWWDAYHGLMSRGK